MKHLFTLTVLLLFTAQCKTAETHEAEKSSAEQSTNPADAIQDEARKTLAGTDCTGEYYEKNRDICDGIKKLAERLDAVAQDDRTPHRMTEHHTG